MTESDRSRSSSVASTIADIISRLHNRLSEISLRTQRILISEIHELSGDDAQILTLLGDTVTANLETVFTALRNSIPLDEIEPPTVALEYARRLAQRDVPVDVLVRAYRIGHQTVFKILIHQIRQLGLDGETTLDVTDRLTTETFEYIDWISQRAIATYEDERTRWHESRNHDRATHVRDLLKGGDTDVDAMTMAIRYPLRRSHLALVVWFPETSAGSETARLERFIQQLTEAIAPREPHLYIPADRLTAWAWIPAPVGSPSPLTAAISEFVDKSDASPFVAIGGALAGVDGFRRSHQQAMEARRVALSDGNRTKHVIEACEPGVLLAGLLTEDAEGLRVWVSEVLGPLASATENDERLRETVHTFLRSGSSFKAAAAELHLHFNTVRYRVERAIERRGRSIDDDRLDVEVALRLCSLLGDSVLSKS